VRARAKGGMRATKRGKFAGLDNAGASRGEDGAQFRAQVHQGKVPSEHTDDHAHGAILGVREGGAIR
jgi:hypothetical protein